MKLHDVEEPKQNSRSAIYLMLCKKLNQFVDQNEYFEVTTAGKVPVSAKHFRIY